MNHQINIVHLAIEAAGGPDKVSAEFGLGRATPGSWKRKHMIPVQYVARIVEMGSGVITEKQITDFVAQSSVQRLIEKKEKRAAKLSQ